MPYTEALRACPSGYSDHVYKTAHGVSVPLRVWPADTNSESAPWLFWLHGGGFITGKWFIIANAWVNEAFKTNGYHVVSVGYRLLPHAGLDEMMEDLQDAFQWCLSNLPRICGPKAVALDRYVVGGESAGGTLASICGYKFLPRPKAVFDLYGAVDLADPIYCIWDPVEESSFVPLYLRERKEEDLATALSRRDLRNAEVYGLSDSKLTPSTPFKKIRELWGRDDIDRNEKHYLRTDMNKYMFSRNVLLSTLLRKERFSTKQAYLDECTRWSASLIARKEGTYPPALFLHGADDPLVPLAQSMDFARLLTKLDVPVKEVYAEGEGHCFDYSIAGPDSKGWKEYIVPCMEFLNEHVKRPL